MSKIKPTNEVENVETFPSKTDRNLVDKPAPPTRSHSCTDIICLLLFLIFIIGQVILSILIFASGASLTEFLLPHDSTGQICQSPTPSLLFLDIVSCLNVDSLVTSCRSTSICVPSCPTDNLFYLISAHRQLMYQTYCQTSGLNRFFANNRPSTVNQSLYLTLALQGICPLYIIASTNVFGRCIPSFLSASYNDSQSILAFDTSRNQTLQITDFSQTLNFGQVAQAAQYLLNLMNIKTIAQSVLEDFVNSAVLIVVLLLISAVASFIYVVIMRWILGPLIFISTVGIVGGLSFATYFCVAKYLELRSQSNQGFILTTNFNYYLSLSTTWLVFAIIAGIVLLIVLLLIIVLIKRVRLAIRLIGEASRAVTSVCTSLFFPFLPLALQLGFLAYFVTTAVALACSGQRLFKVANSSNLTAGNSSWQVGDSCSPSNDLNLGQGLQCVFYRFGFDYSSVYGSIIQALNTYQWAPQLYNAFMLFWVQTFLIGFNQMVLAGCFGIWYWSQSASPLTIFKSLKNTLVYHLGSIAFGSLLIAICKLLRTMIQLVERRLKSASAHQQQLSCFITFISCCCRCCIWFLEKVLKFISRNSYIMTAIWSVSFCRGARDALALLAANPVRALVLDRVTDFVLFLGRLCITAGVGILAFCFFSKSFYVHPQWTKYFAPELNYYWLPLIVVILGAYFISKTFFTVFEMAVDTVFLCAMKDLAVNDGSEQKPYMMSKRLLKILNVHNMVPNEKN